MPAAEVGGVSVEALLAESSATHVVSGPGIVETLGHVARELGGQRLLLVTDPGLREAGHEERVLESLTVAGFSGESVVVFDEVTPNPTTVDVDRALETAQTGRVDLIIGLGGGSSMDCAKGVNFLLTNGGQMRDYQGVGKATKPMLPMIAVPTTAGTGSEAQSFALIADSETHMKMACGDKKAACRIALLDPELTLTMPPLVTATTGIDAISHALETAVTTRRNDVSDRFSHESWVRLAEAFPRVIRDGTDAQARSTMLYGAHLAGAAIENSMLGATHALANPLSAHYGMTHGTAIGIMLPHVIRYNQAAAGAVYRQLLAEANLITGELETDEAANQLAAFIEQIVTDAGLPTALRQCDVLDDKLEIMAEEAAEQWTGQFNPRPVTIQTLKELYECASPGPSA
ncbi:MAG: iron-containing alcohol dehydrogenase [Planctomycetaceae bacterium]